MANLFDTTEYPTTEPETLVAGDRWLWKRSDLTDYPVASYALKYEARLEGDGTTNIQIAASESGTDYLVEVASATTAAYTAGVYQWSAFIERSSDSQRVLLNSGLWTVKPNPAVSTDDPRSHVKKTLDALESTILGKASSDDIVITINGRTLQSMTPKQLLDWYNTYKGLYAQELAVEAAANGKASGNRVLSYLK